MLSVIGAGSYGTALAITVATKKIPVMLYVRDLEQAEQMRRTRENCLYLKGITFPKDLIISSSIKETIEFASDLLIVIPSIAFVDCLQEIAPFLTSRHRIAWATKGLEHGTAMFLSDVAKRELSQHQLNLPLAALSGPTFALELAQGLPTAIALAGTQDDFVDDFCHLMHTNSFRVYKSHDLIALQLGGAVKNVLAIGAGMSDGLGYGANARTALISRGLAEMIRLGLKLGATERGFMGLSGLGDLMLTCTDNQSRNRRLGFMLGQGKTINTALAEIKQVVEGLHMVEEVQRLARKYDVEMPICDELFEVLCRGKSGKDAAKSLLERSQTSE